MIHFPRKHFVFPPVRDPKTRESKRRAVGARPKPKIAAIQSHGNRLEFLQSFVLIRAERFHWFMGNDNVQCTEIDGRMQIINLVMQRPLWTRQSERFNWLTDYSSGFYFATGAHLNSLEFCAVPMIHAVQSIKLQFARCRRSSKNSFSTCAIESVSGTDGDTTKLHLFNAQRFVEWALTLIVNLTRVSKKPQQKTSCLCQLTICKSILRQATESCQL